eukprot:Em0155g5a
MPLSCYDKHRKPVCVKCDAGYYCIKCCKCQNRKRGRPRKVSIEQPEPAAVRSKRMKDTVTVHLEVPPATDDAVSIETISLGDFTTQAQILKALEAMGSLGDESSVRRLPSGEKRRQARSKNDLAQEVMNRIETVFVRGIKAWARMLVPNWNMKSDAEIKKVFSLKSLAPIEAVVGEENRTVVPSVGISPSDGIMLTTMTSAIRDALKHVKRLTSTDARRLLVPLSDLPRAYVASLLTLNVKELMFQAKVDKLYLSHGLTLQTYSETHSRVCQEVIHYAVSFVYSNDNISRLAWEAKKRSPNKDVRWKDLKNVSAMKSLVLKHNIATMYKVYLEKHKNEMPNKMPVGKTLFYDIVNHITGGGKHQEARSGIDYIKVNFHKDNFVIVDKVIDVLVPLSEVNHTLREKLYSLRSDTYTFLNYCYAVHIREAVEAFNETVSHLPPQEHDGQQFSAYQQLNELLRHPDSLDEPATQQYIVSEVQNQLTFCAKAMGKALEQNESNGATTHSPVFALDLVPDRRPNKGPKPGGHMECHACRGPFLFYDKLRYVALTKINEDPTRLAEIADVLVTIHQCERWSYRYMAHVMQATHQDHHMKQAMAEMDCTTAYLVYDFKQKFLAKGFREGGDSYYGKKGMLWWGAGAYVKPCVEVHNEIVEPLEKLHVMIDFARRNVPLQQQMEQVNEDGELYKDEDDDDDEQHEDEDGDQQHEDEDGDQQHEDEDGDQQHEDEDGDEQHEDDDGDQHEDKDGDQQHEDDDGEQHEDEDGDQQHEDDDGGDQQHEDEDGDQQHEDEDGDQQHEDDDGGDQQHEDEDGDQQHEDDDGDQQHEDDDGDQHEDEDGDQQHEDEDGDEQHEDDDGDQHEDEDGDQQHEDDDGDQHEDEDGDQHEDEDGDQQHEDEDGDQQHEDDDGDQHEDDDGDQQHEDEDGDQQHEDDDGDQHEDDDGDQQHEDEDGDQHEDEDGDQHEDEDGDQQHEDDDGDQHEDEDGDQQHEDDDDEQHEDDDGDQQHEDEDGDQHEDDDGDQQHEDDDGDQHEDEDDDQHEDDDGDQHEDDGDQQHEDEDGDQQHEDEDGDQQHEGDDCEQNCDSNQYESEEGDSIQENTGEVNGQQVDETGKAAMALHFIDCIVQGEQKADSSVVLSCLEAAFHALRKRFPHIKKVIVQSDNAKNFGGKHTKLLLPYVCSAAGLKLVAYYHNEAQSGKDVCDTHFSHQQTHVNTYLIQGEGGRKVSTPKQLAVALMENPIMNTTVLLLKLDFKAPYRSTVVPCVSGISDFYAAQYVTTVNEEKIVRFYNSLGQKVPSKCVSIPSCEASHEIGSKSVNFTGVTVLLSSDNTSNCEQAKKDKKRYMYKRGSLEVSKHRKQLIENQSKDERALDMIRAIYPQCAKYLYHFKSPQLLKKHVCTGTRESWDALSVAMRHADHLLATMDFSITGAIDQTASMFLDDGDTPPYATFEPNFFAGWAHTKKNMHPELTTKVRSVIHECWRAGENKELGKVKISAAGVYDRLEEMQLQKTIRLSELSIRLSELSIRLSELSIRLSELPIRLSELPIRLSELPIRLSELPIRLSELPIRLSELSIRLSELTIRLSELPIRLSELSIRLSELPIRLSELTIRLSELPIRLSELPIRLSELSIRLSELPIRLSELPIRLSELPIRLSELSIRLSELAIRLSELPIRLSELPIRLSELPIRLSELPIRLSELTIRLSELPIRLSELPIRLSELPIRLSELSIRLSELSIRLSELSIRLSELTIRLSELPLPGKILAV